jgi:RND family efflux transporter MFP subunit
MAAVGSRLGITLKENPPMNIRSFYLPLACASLVLTGEAAFAADPEVKVVQPVPREVTDAEVFTGRTEAVTTVELRPRVSGYLTKVAFKDGAEVKKGDLLFEIDPRPYQAEVEKAEAGLTLAQSQVKQADADYARTKALVDKNALSREELDKAAAGREEAGARLGAAKAVLDSARLTLNFTKVTAPISGRIGRRLLDAGNVVKADETHLATLVSEGPVYVYFDMDERTLLRLRKGGQLKAGKGPAVPVAAGVGDEKDFPHKGQIDFLPNEVDPAKGNIRARAVLANPDGALTPGLFTQVRLPLGEPYKALLVPERAIRASQAQKTVYVVNEKDVVETRPVTLGSREGDLVAVKEGLKAGDRVVISGLGKLKAGMKVKPQEEPIEKKEK